MTENIWLVLAVVGALIIFALAIYAGKLLMQLKQQNVAQAKAEQERQAQLQKHDRKVLDSLLIIVKAMQEQQCEYSEGAWRLTVLMDSLKLTPTMSAEFPAIVELYESIKHHSILAERKKLPKQQRMKQDVERMQAEAKLTEQISLELDTLYETATAQRASISESS
ncbi:DUF2489 domain-containing protein [Thalassotalea euphylliae]|uniref:DUF2489 domain-containing protein n=1 Tax=Thalassotalea euphylliae TaxID=1655234 RepID=A0A3E0UJG4_9GAMM|nr:DUF2489 domain-containing protein [Thalassotalea euphylliae]REL37091.1 DUF2489 domain-containing protein [Thalassotalea euphylliae]